MSPRTAAEISTEARRVCKERRAIAIDMAANIAYAHWSVGPFGIKKLILDLIDMTQSEHDALVIRYHLKERYNVVRGDQTKT